MKPVVFRLGRGFGTSILAATLLLTAAACGSDAGPALTDPVPGDESPTDPPPPLPGIFLDAAVWGLSFQSGDNPRRTTDQSGAFEYVPGEELRFFLGGVELGVVLNAGAVVTPRDFAVPENIARFLQSLDADQNPANGIDVREAAAILASRTVPSTVFANTDRASFETDPAIVAALLDVGVDLVDADEAMAHLELALGGGFTTGELADQTFVLIASGEVGIMIFDALADSTDTGSTGLLVLSPGAGDEFAWNVSSGLLTIDEGGSTSQLSRAGTSERAISAIIAPTIDDPSPQPVTLLRPLVLTEQSVAGEMITPTGSDVRTLAMEVGGESVEFEYRSDGTVSRSGVGQGDGTWSLNEFGPFLRTMFGNQWFLSLLLDGSFGVDGELLLADVTFLGEDPVSGDPLLTWNSLARTAFTRVDDVVLAPTDSCNDVPARSVATFADPALADKIRLDLGLVEQANLTCGILTDVRTLFPTPEVGSLVGIQNLTGLVELSLNGTGVTDLAPLATVPWLTSLQIANSTGITDFSPVAQLTRLESLRVSSSGVTDVGRMLPIELTSLTRLQLDRNSISNLELPRLPNVTWLDVSYNQVSDLGRLVFLNPDLALLNLSNNAISDLGGLNSILSIDTLYLSFNSIVDIAPIPVAGTKVLHLQANRISNIEPLEAGRALTELLLAGNRISSGSPLSGLINLRELTLDGNEIYRIDYDDTGQFFGVFGSVAFLEDLRALEVLGLSAINMRDSSGLRSLTNGIRRLALAGNFIGSTNEFERLTALEWLDLQGNASDALGTSPIRPDSLTLDGLRRNLGIGAGDVILLGNNVVRCEDVAVLEGRGAFVTSDCSS